VDVHIPVYNILTLPQKKLYSTAYVKTLLTMSGGAEIARPEKTAPCPLRWFRLPSVLRLDVEENDWTARVRVPTSTTAGAAIRTDVCDGGLWGGVSGVIFPRVKLLCRPSALLLLHFHPLTHTCAVDGVCSWLYDYAFNVAFNCVCSCL